MDEVQRTVHKVYDGSSGCFGRGFAPRWSPLRILALLPLAALLAVSAAPTADAWTIVSYGVHVQVFDQQGNISPCVGIEGQGSGFHVDQSAGLIIYAGPPNGPNGYAGYVVNANCP